MYKLGMDRIAVLPDTGHSENRIPDFQPDIRLVPDTGYFNACSLFDRVTLIIETSQIFNQKPNIRFFNIQYPAGYRKAEKWPDFAGYRILNQISGPSLNWKATLYILLKIFLKKVWKVYLKVIKCWKMPKHNDGVWPVKIIHPLPLNFLEQKKWQ